MHTFARMRQSSRRYCGSQMPKCIFAILLRKRTKVCVDLANNTSELASERASDLAGTNAHNS